MVDPSECVVVDDREYLCFDKIELDGQTYVCLITTETPTEIVFAETAKVDGAPQIRLIGDRATKQKISAILQEKVRSLTTQPPA